MHHCPRSIPLCIQHHIHHCKWVDPPIPEIQQFQYFTLKRPHSRYNTLSTHITFVRCRWVLAFLSIIKKFDLENPSSRSWFRWTFKVTTWVKHSIDSHPFRSKSINHPIPEIQHFQNLTLRIQGQGHGWGEGWKSQHGSNIISTHIFFVPCQSAIPLLRYNFFKIWPWKSKVKVMVEVKVESYKVGVTFYRLTSLSFHVSRPSHSWDTAFSKFDLENQRPRSWVRWMLKATTWVQHSINSHPFRSMSIGHPIPEIQLFQNLTLKIQGQGHGWGECWKSQH